MAQSDMLEAAREEYTSAVQQVRNIVNYWFAQGYWGVRAAIKRDHDAGVWRIESNIGPLGYPPKV